MIESDVENSGWEIDVGDLALVRDDDRVKLQLHIKAGAMTGENIFHSMRGIRVRQVNRFLSKMQALAGGVKGTYWRLL